MSNAATKSLAVSSAELARPLHVLLVEDSPPDAELCLAELRRAGFEPVSDVVATPQEFAERLRSNHHDVILADYRLPNWTGMDALALLKQLGRDIPFLLVTGTLGEETAVECIKQGVTDYVLKEHLERLPVAVHRALEEKVVREERDRAEEARREANEQLAARVDELSRQTREITLVNEMGELLQTCSTPDEAYAVIGQFLGKLFPADSGALCMLDTSRNLVEAVAVWGQTQPDEHVFAPEECWALRRGQPHLRENSSWCRLCPLLAHRPAGTTACVPMMAQGKTLGILFVQSGAAEPGQLPSAHRSLTDADRRLPVTVAEQIALALANLRLREELRTQSVRDPLTGLFNRRYQEESLERELLRAARKQRPLGLIMLDLDHFKSLNDAFGHEAGDALLREVGRFLASHTRREDIVCRYGGDEFVFILPETSLAVARNRAEQLQESCRSLRTQYRGHVFPPTTVSLGVVVFPEHGTTASTLWRAADAALYRAKAEGRDRVVVGRAIEEETGSPLAHETPNS